MRKTVLIAAIMTLAVPAMAQTSRVQSGPEAHQEQQSATQQATQPAPHSSILDASKAEQKEQAGGNNKEGRDGVGTSEVAHAASETTIANFTVVLAGATLLLMVATGALWWERWLGESAQER